MTRVTGVSEARGTTWAVYAEEVLRKVKNKTETEPNDYMAGSP